jgi:hypothetical protein
MVWPVRARGVDPGLPGLKSSALSTTLPVHQHCTKMIHTSSCL